MRRGCYYCGLFGVDEIPGEVAVRLLALDETPLRAKAGLGEGARIFARAREGSPHHRATWGRPTHIETSGRSRSGSKGRSATFSMCAQRSAPKFFFKATRAMRLINNNCRR